MNPATSTRFAILIALGAACLSGNAAFAAERTPDSENGRYTFSPTADGVMRLDTRTGTVSNCSSSAAGWACFAVPDERKALLATSSLPMLDDELESLFARFFALSGLDQASLKARASEPAVLGGVLDFVLGDERLVLSLAETFDVPPEAFAKARRKLPGAVLES